MTDRIFLEAQLLRLCATFPTFKLSKETREMYVQRLSRQDDQDIGAAVDAWLDRGKKFPTIADLLERAKEAKELRVRQRVRESEDHFKRLGAIDGRVDWGARFNTPKFYDAFERGRQRILDRGWKDITRCPCMECQWRRLDGTLNDGGPVEDHLREAHQTLGRP